MAAAPTKTVHINEAFTVQTEPLLADEWVHRLTDGYLTTVVEVDENELVAAIGDDQAVDLLARIQAAHTEPYMVDWRIVGAEEGTLYVRVSNHLGEWASDPENVASYNAEVGPEYRLTPERLAAIGVA